MGAPAVRAWPFIAALGGALLDQLGKGWAEATVKGQGVVPVLDGILELRYTRNPGAFFGLGGALPSGVRRAILIGAGLGIAVLLVSLYRRTQPATSGMHLGVAALLAGTLGNLRRGGRLRHAGAGHDSRGHGEPGTACLNGRR